MREIVPDRLVVVREILAVRPAASFVALAYGFSWSVWVAASVAFDAAAPQFLAVVVGAFGPALAGAVVTSATGTDLRGWIRGLFRVRIAPRWYLAAMGIPLGFAVVETAVAAALGAPIVPASLGSRVLLWGGTFLLALVLTGGNEEPGWRGFLQARLQHEYGVLTAALLVGTAWLVWHLPADFLLSALGGGTEWSTGRALLRLATVPFAVVLAWLYNASDGSVVPVMLAHAGWNTTSALVPVGRLAAGTPAVDESTELALTATRVGLLALVAAAVVVRYDRRTLAPGEPPSSVPGSPHGEEDPRGSGAGSPD